MRKAIKDPTIFKCPNCGRTLEVGLLCECDDPVNFCVLEERKGKGIICVAYTDKKGNIWRFR